MGQRFLPEAHSNAALLPSIRRAVPCDVVGGLELSSNEK